MGAITITPFGKELRKLRIDLDEVLMTMADKLEITAAYLSSIETGRREIPKDFITKIANIYSLSEDQIKKLKLASVETQNKVTLEIPAECEDYDYLLETAFLFANNFLKLNKSQLENMRKILLSVNNTDVNKG